MKAFIIAFTVVVMLSGCSTTADDPPEVSNALPILAGVFVSSDHYNTQGDVNLSDERTSLDLINFETDEGPRLELYLTTNLQATDFINLGALQGLKGDFTYTIAEPENIDFSKHKYVVVWCVEASAEFGHALLKEQ